MKTFILHIFVLLFGVSFGSGNWESAFRVGDCVLESVTTIDEEEYGVINVPVAERGFRQKGTPRCHINWKKTFFP